MNFTSGAPIVTEMFRHSCRASTIAISALLLATVLPSFGQSGVKLNEVFANNISVPYRDGIVSDWVELFNTTDQPVNLAGTTLSDDKAAPQKWFFPIGTTIPAKGYLVVLLDNTRNASLVFEANLNAGFALKAAGDDLYFFGPGGVTILDSVAFGIQAGDLTLGRVADGAGAWTLTQPTPNGANVAQTLGSIRTLKVNEWMADPASGDDWFELYNPDPAPVALGGLYLTDTGREPTQSRIPALSYIGVGQRGFVRFWAAGSTNDGPDHLVFKLSASGEAVLIFGADLQLIDTVAFNQQTTDVSQGRLPDGATAIASFPATATPGGPNLIQLRDLVVNELLSHTDPPLEDAVEFYNSSAAPITIGGWWLSNSRTDLKRYRIPAGTVVPAKGYKVFYEFEFNGPTAAKAFTFNSAHGDQVWLAQTDAQGNLTGSVSGEEFEASENGVSFIRHTTSIPGDYKFVAAERRTFGVDNPNTLPQFRTGTGAVNSAPRVGPVVINEIMFHPPSADPLIDNIDDEYIELRSTTNAPVALYDIDHATNGWRLKDAVTYTFAAPAAIPALGTVLVVSFDPVATPQKAAAFRAKYSVPASTLLFGPYSGKLDNAGEAVELYKPDPPQLPPHPDEGFVPYVRVDKVNYLDVAPWPSGADGSGNSLQRKVAETFGNDPANWQAAAPTAGRSNTPGPTDTDSDGMPDDWELANGLNPGNPADAALDADSDGLTNGQEYVAGTDPRQASSRLQISEIVPSSASMLLRFQAAADRTYTVQYRDGLDAASTWKKLSDVSAQTTTRLVEVPDAGTAGRALRYYRLVTPATN